MVLRPAFVLLSLLTLVAQSGTFGLVPIILGGNERLAWDQAADDDAEIATFRYIAYVDGQPVDLTGESCSRSSPQARFSCSAPLPPLSIGLHTIDIADRDQWIVGRDQPVEPPPGSRRASQPERDRNCRRQPAANRRLSRAIGVRLTVTPIVTGLDDPVDLAFMPDGGMVVGERAGLLRIVRDGRLVATPASPVFERRSEQERLLAVAVDADFDRSHFVYAIYTTTIGRGASSHSVW